MPQPKSGSITRSPGAVLRMIQTASSMSCSARAYVSRPRASGWIGKRHPWPRKGRSCMRRSLLAGQDVDDRSQRCDEVLEDLRDLTDLVGRAGHLAERRDLDRAAAD